MPGLCLNELFVFVVQIHQDRDNHSLQTFYIFSLNMAWTTCSSFTRGKVWQTNTGMTTTVLHKNISSFPFRPKEENVYAIFRVKFINYALPCSVCLIFRNCTDYREECARQGELLALFQDLASKSTSERKQNIVSS